MEKGKKFELRAKLIRSWEKWEQCWDQGEGRLIRKLVENDGWNMIISNGSVVEGNAATGASQFGFESKMRVQDSNLVIASGKWEV